MSGPQQPPEQLAGAARDRHQPDLGLAASRHGDNEAVALLHPDRPSAMGKTIAKNRPVVGNMLDPFQAALVIDADSQGGLLLGWGREP